MKAPTGEWKSIMAGIMFGLGVTGWALMWFKHYGTSIHMSFLWKLLELLILKHFSAIMLAIY